MNLESITSLLLDYVRLQDKIGIMTSILFLRKQVSNWTWDLDPIPIQLSNYARSSHYRYGT